MSKRKLHIDIETFSSVDISKAGAYKYVSSLDFEILLIAYAFDDEPVEILEQQLPQFLEDALLDPDIEKWAHNAAFERNAFKAVGIDSPADQWRCTSVKAAYCGLPLSLGAVSSALGLGEDKAKLASGKALIKYFCCPVKATKVNGGRTRNFPHHNPAKWEDFKAYCIRDVEAEREIDRRLSRYDIPDFEQQLYTLDQKINDRGVLIDLNLAQNAKDNGARFSEELYNRTIELTGLANPNSVAQLKTWLGQKIGRPVTSLNKTDLPELLKSVEGLHPEAAEVLKIRKIAAKTSVKKYDAMLECAGDDSRVRGLLQFYGANRTGRWAGRLIQVQNLPKNFMTDLDLARELVAAYDYDGLTLLYDNLPGVLSQLIRTAFIAPEGCTFAVADFSAIEARVLSWLAGEQWRLDVFNTHGKIYEASASKMFNVPIEQITKGSTYRDKGKVAELALGYQGGVGALAVMGAEAMGLSESECKALVTQWRQANPSIVQLWRTLDTAAIKAIRTGKPQTCRGGLITFEFDGSVMTIKLPSGRSLFYQSPRLVEGKYGDSIRYKGMNQETKVWGWVDTYGGKLCENIIQAIARDVLADSMTRLDALGAKIVMHVHDEAVIEIHDSGLAEAHLYNICGLMGEPIDWAPGLPLAADGYLTRYYKKD